MKQVKAATVEICYAGKDYCFRCPECGSLNLNGEIIAATCPDCRADYSVPEIVFCECELNETQN